MSENMDAMSSNDTPNAAVGRTFQVWDYSPSHRTLLVRSPGTGDLPENFDLRFTGVSHVDLPTRFTLTSISSVNLPSKEGLSREFLIIHTSGHGAVRAERLIAEENAKGLFEGLSDASARVQDSSIRFEFDVLAALQSAFPDAQVLLNKSDGPDIEVTKGNRRALVDAMWTSESSPIRQVRSRVMGRVDRWKQDDLADTPLFVVVGGLRASEVAAALPDHLLTAFGARAEAVVWDAAGRRRLIERIESAVAPKRASASSDLEVFRDSGGGHRWRLRARNGETLAVSESYATSAAASAAASAMRAAVSDVHIVERADG